MTNDRPQTPNSRSTPPGPPPPPPFSSSFGRRLDREASEALTALWLLGDAVIGEKPPRNEQDLEALYDALQTVTWFIDDLDPDPDSDPEAEAFQAAVERMKARHGGSAEDRAS